MTDRDSIPAEQIDNAFVDAVMETVVNREVGDLNLRVRDVVAIARWLAPTARTLLAEAWDEGHGTSNGGCVYWPDCAQVGDHVNPYRDETRDGLR